jgi:hypothetical protein
MESPGGSINNGSSVKTTADTHVCNLLDGVSTTVLIIELLLILSINSGFRIGVDMWGLSTMIHQQRF